MAIKIRINHIGYYSITIIVIAILVISCNKKEQNGSPTEATNASIDSEKHNEEKADENTAKKAIEKKPKLVVYIEEGRWDNALALLKEKIELPQLQNKQTLLHIVALQESPNLSVVGKLVEMGVSINSKDDFNDAPQGS